MTVSSDHDLLMKIHDRVFQCATKDDVSTIAENTGKCCVEEHERRYHSDSSPGIIIQARGTSGNKLSIAIASAISAGAAALLARFGLGQ